MPRHPCGSFDLFFTQQGVGSPIVLIHDWTCDSHDWIWQLEDLNSQYRVIALDLRGHGRSDIPTKGYEGAGLAQDVVSLIDGLDLEQVAVIGHGLGAAIGNRIAVEHPRRVSTLVTIDGMYGFGDELGPEIHGLLDALKTPTGLEEICGLFERAYHRPSTPRALCAWHTRRILGMPLHVVRDILEQVAFAPDAFMFRAAAETYLTRRECPVLAFRTHQDSADWEIRFTSNPRSRSICWPESGHFLHQERPADFNREVLQWCTALKRDS